MGEEGDTPKNFKKSLADWGRQSYSLWLGECGAWSCRGRADPVCHSKKFALRKRTQEEAHWYWIRRMRFLPDTLNVFVIFLLQPWNTKRFILAHSSGGPLSTIRWPSWLGSWWGHSAGRVLGCHRASCSKREHTCVSVVPYKATRL